MQLHKSQQAGSARTNFSCQRQESRILLRSAMCDPLFAKLLGRDGCKMKPWSSLLRLSLCHSLAAFEGACMIVISIRFSRSIQTIDYQELACLGQSFCRHYSANITNLITLWQCKQCKQLMHCQARVPAYDSKQSPRRWSMEIMQRMCLLLIVCSAVFDVWRALAISENHMSHHTSLASVADGHSINYAFAAKLLV